MSSVNVSTSAQLLAAVKSAQPGDIIHVESGTYSGISLSNLNFSGAVTITSADASHPAVFTDLAINGSSNIALSDLTLIPGRSGSVNDFGIYNSSEITLDGIVAGSATLAQGIDENGLLIRNSSDVTVKNSEFHDVGFGIVIADNTGLNISNNTFHDLRSDGIRGGGNSDVTIADNSFTSFYPVAGDHPDAIQFWTTNTTQSAENITITGNVITRGDGSPMQGIFMGDEVGLPYKNVTISDNLLIGTLFNGIGAVPVSSGSITDNTVVGLPDQLSWIITGVPGSVTEAGNVATTYNTSASNSSVPHDNVQIAVPLDGGAAILASWLADHAPSTGTTVDQPPSTDTGLNVGVGDVAPPVSQPIETPTTIHLDGGSGADRLYADKLLDTTIHTGAGNDSLIGNGLHSSLYGGTGDDTYYVSGIGDKVFESAGEGYDTVVSTIDYTLAANVEQLRLTGTAHFGGGNDGDNRLIGNAEANILYGYDGNDLIQGGDGNDTIYGGNGNNDLRGEGGNDTIHAGPGNDSLSGGSGDDILIGGDGNNNIDGGTGHDQMWGGAGRDIFIVRDESVVAHDVKEIFDFKVGEDIIGLSTIDANTNTVTNDAFKFIGSDAFSHHAGELQAVAFGDGMKVSGDVNGDGAADFSIVLHNLHAIAANSFYL